MRKIKRPEVIPDYGLPLVKPRIFTPILEASKEAEQPASTLRGQVSNYMQTSEHDEETNRIFQQLISGLLEGYRTYNRERGQ
jgi:hypothetical protein